MSDVDTARLAEDAGVPEEALDPDRDEPEPADPDTAEHLAEDTGLQADDLDERPDPAAPTTPPPPD